MLLRQNGSTDFCDRIAKTTEQFTAKEWIAPLKTKYDPVLLSYYSHFVAHGFASVVIKWLENDMPESPNELADILGHIMDFGLDSIRKMPASK